MSLIFSRTRTSSAPGPAASGASLLVQGALSPFSTVSSTNPAFQAVLSSFSTVSSTNPAFQAVTFLLYLSFRRHNSSRRQVSNKPASQNEGMLRMLIEADASVKLNHGSFDFIYEPSFLEGDVYCTRNGRAEVGVEEYWRERGRNGSRLLK
jgi:hypothetical protein